MRGKYIYVLICLLLMYSTYSNAKDRFNDNLPSGVSIPDSVSCIKDSFLKQTQAKEVLKNSPVFFHYTKDLTNEDKTKIAEEWIQKYQCNDATYYVKRFLALADILYGWLLRYSAERGAYYSLDFDELFFYVKDNLIHRFCDGYSVNKLKSKLIRKANEKNNSERLEAHEIPVKVRSLVLDEVIKEAFTCDYYQLGM
jgi:hypothetical protein